MTTAIKEPCYLYAHLSAVKESLSKSSERAKAQISGLAPRVRSKDGRRLLAQLEETIRRISDQIRFIGSPLSTNLLNDKPAEYSAPAQSPGGCAGWDIERRNVHALKNYLYDLASDLKLATEALPVERALIVKRLKDDTARYYASLQGELNRKGYARIDACAFMKALIADLRPSLEEEDYRITDRYGPFFACFGKRIRASGHLWSGNYIRNKCSKEGLCSSKVPAHIVVGGRQAVVPFGHLLFRPSSESKKKLQPSSSKRIARSSMIRCRLNTTTDCHACRGAPRHAAVHLNSNE